MTTNNSSVNDSFAWVWNSFTTFAVHWNCAGGTQFSLGAQQQASWNGSAYRIDIQPAGTRSGPWGGYSQYAHIDLPWTNGSPSMIAFSSTPVGVDGLGRVLSVTGTINVTTASGGALALIH